MLPWFARISKSALFQGRDAFGVTWGGVGYHSYYTDKLNAFQLLLVDRPDTGTGNFDIHFNYDQIQWELVMRVTDSKAWEVFPRARVILVAIHWRRTNCPAHRLLARCWIAVPTVWLLGAILAKRAAMFLRFVMELLQFQTKLPRLFC